MLGRIDGCHLNRLYRVQSQFNGTLHIVTDMAFLENIVDVLVICTKHHIVCRQIVLHNTRHQCIYIAFTAAFTDQRHNTKSQAF